MYVALDRYVKHDHAKEWKAWEEKISIIDKAIKGISGVKTKVVLPPIANHTPSLSITWDDKKINLTKESMGEKLRKGSPSIEVIAWEAVNNIRLTVFMLKPDQEKIVAKRIREELLNASV